MPNPVGELHDGFALLLVPDEETLPAPDSDQSPKEPKEVSLAALTSMVNSFVCSSTLTGGALS